MTKRFDDRKVEGRIQIPSKKWIERGIQTKNHNEEQSKLLNKCSEEIQKGNEYLDSFSDINDETGLKRAYESRTDTRPPSREQDTIQRKIFQRTLWTIYSYPFTWSISQRGIRQQTTSSNTT